MSSDESGCARDFLADARRVVIKVGSAVLTNRKGLDVNIIESLTEQIAGLASKGKEIVLVSSGAVAAGLAKLPDLTVPKTIPEKQALAALGQSELMRAYEEAFDAFGLKVAQVLLTKEGLIPRHRYINAKNTLKTLLHWKIVPIVNENDTVATEELQFTDNDALSVLIVNLVEAEALICLSDIDGLYSSDPRKDSDAERIPVVERVDKTVMEMASRQPGRAGRGGMYSKLEAARMVNACGVPMVVAGGRTERVLERIFKGEELGTLFCARKDRRIYGRKPWIAFALEREGILDIDEGAVRALSDRGKSLLPVGVCKVHGTFRSGACVVCRGPNGEEVAVGITNYSSEELKRISGCHSEQVCKFIDHPVEEEVIHRDNMVVL